MRPVLYNSAVSRFIGIGGQGAQDGGEFIAANDEALAEIAEVFGEVGRQSQNFRVLARIVLESQAHHGRFSCKPELAPPRGLNARPEAMLIAFAEARHGKEPGSLCPPPVQQFERALACALHDF